MKWKIISFLLFFNNLDYLNIYILCIKFDELFNII